jgi:hypothetical protein
MRTDEMSVGELELTTLQGEIVRLGELVEAPTIVILARYYG